MSTCFGLKTAIASAMVNCPIGRRIEYAVQKAGVTPYYLEQVEAFANGGSARIQR